MVCRVRAPEIAIPVSSTAQPAGQTSRLATPTSPHTPPRRRLLAAFRKAGAGKSRLAVDLAGHIAGVEVVSADSMKVYHGLDVFTNKVPLHEQNGVPHHLLSIIDPSLEFTCRNFRHHAFLLNFQWCPRCGWLLQCSKLLDLQAACGACSYSDNQGDMDEGKEPRAAFG